MALLSRVPGSGLQVVSIYITKQVIIYFQVSVCLTIPSSGLEECPASGHIACGIFLHQLSTSCGSCSTEIGPSTQPPTVSRLKALFMWIKVAKRHHPQVTVTAKTACLRDRQTVVKCVRVHRSVLNYKLDPNQVQWFRQRPATRRKYA